MIIEFKQRENRNKPYWRDRYNPMFVHGSCFFNYNIKVDYEGCGLKLSYFMLDIHLVIRDQICDNIYNGIKGRL